MTKSVLGLKIVFSGFRDEVLQQEIEAGGGRVMTAVSKLTNIVIFKGNETAKVVQARDNGIEVLTLSQFKTKYLEFKSPKKAVLFKYNKPLTYSEATKLWPQIHNGDLILGDKNGYVVCKNKLVQLQVHTLGNFLIPLVPGIEDPVAFYSDLDDYISLIALPLSDKFVAFNLDKMSKLQRTKFTSAKYFYATYTSMLHVYLGEKVYQIEYNGEENIIEVEDNVTFLIRTQWKLMLDEDEEPVFYAPGAISLAVIKKLLPSKKWTVEKYDTLLRVKGPRTEYKMFLSKLEHAEYMRNT